MRKNIPKRSLQLALLAVLFALLAVGGWLYLSKPASEAPALDRSALSRPYSPSMGRPDAPVVIVEFFDPACGTCRSFYPLVKQMMAEHPGRIRLLMRYAPFHKGSDKVVALLAAAHNQGQFWPTLEALFAGQDDWASNHTAKIDLAWKYLNKQDLNLEQLAFDLTSPDIQQAIEQDLRDANKLAVSQTPEYFVNGRPLPSFGFEQLRQLVNEELARNP